MHPDPCSGFPLIVLLLLTGMRWLGGRPSLFHGIWVGFWNGFFNWLFVGSRRSSGSIGSLGCFVLAIILLASMGCVASILSTIAVGLAVPAPCK